MLTHMRTTLIIDDDVLRQAKQRAAERRLTVSEVVNEALRESLRRPARPAAPFTMVTYGSQDRRVTHEPKDFATFVEEEERARLSRR